jgi:protein-S-isoprenylcysteine O-methyltransferase Ste14
MSTAVRITAATIFGLGLLLVVLPWQLLRLDEKASPGLAMLAAYGSGLFFLAGVGLVFSGAYYLIHRGNGTLLPFAPPRRMVVAGPYAHVQHPIWLGLWFIVCGEALWMQSTLLALYAVIVAIVANLYIMKIEEPRLGHRFGVDYQAYRTAVPRWFPFQRRRTPSR